MDRRRLWLHLRALRTNLLGRLILPIVLVVPVALIGGWVILGQSFASSVDEMVDRRAETVLNGIVRSLEVRQSDMATFSLLLAEAPGLSDAIANEDKRRLAQIILPLQAKMGLQFVEVHSRAGEIISFGHDEEAQLGVTEESEPAWIARALGGMSVGWTLASGDGAVVAGAAPVKGPSGIVGAIEAGETMGAEALGKISGRDGVELAVIFDGRVVVSTITDRELASVIAAQPWVDGRDALPASLVEPYGFRATTHTFEDGARLVAFVPIDDLAAIESRQLAALLITVVVILGILLALTLAVTRTIRRPVGTMLTLAQEMAAGATDRRVAPTGIREFDELGAAVNNMAEQVARQIAEMSFQARHDSLVSLPNRSAFAAQLRHALRPADPVDDHLVALLFLDIDNFKTVNDSLGHESGDRILAAIAHRLRSVVPAEHLLARFGGDEFTVLMLDLDGPDRALEMAERITRVFDRPFVVAGRQAHVAASIGLVIEPSGQADPEGMLRDADLAMYRAKALGRGRFVRFEPSMRDGMIERLGLEGDLRRAIDQDALTLVYQPIRSIETGELVGAEALARWHHVTKGPIGPDVFIPMAEEMDLIGRLGAWALREACTELARWQASSRSAIAPWVSVNASARQISDPHFGRTIRETIKATGIDPSGLIIEVTESIFLADLEIAIQRLTDIRRGGVRIALDDFGTGYSSLSYLARLPIDILKIDGSFISALEGNAVEAQLARAILSLGPILGLTTLAEGIETEQQQAILRDLHCELGQGYLLGRPGEPSSVAVELARGCPTGRVPLTSLRRPTARAGAPRRALSAKAQPASQAATKSPARGLSGR